MLFVVLNKLDACVLNSFRGENKFQKDYIYFTLVDLIFGSYVIIKKLFNFFS